MKRRSKRYAWSTGVFTALALVAAPVAPAVSLLRADVLPPTVATIVDGDVTEYQWMLDVTNAEAAWTESTGAGAVVAVIDTGVDATHPDLSSRITRGARVVKDDEGVPALVPSTIKQTSDDWYGHGSHVSGIIAGDADGSGMTGIAPQALIMPIAMETVRLPQVQFIDMVRAGVTYAAANGADVVNMSLGFPRLNWGDPSHRFTRALDRLCGAIHSATADGTVVVASAGNAGDWGNPQYVPASCPATVTVSALTPALHRTYWSSFDGDVDLAAPGQDVLSVDSTVANRGPTPHIQMSGTSMASPVVAGVAALLSAEHPGWGARHVANQLRGSAQDIGVPGQDPDTGFGLVDAAAALGVPASAAGASDFFTTWAYRDPENARQAYVSWTTPQVHAVSGYTVTIHRQDGTTQDYNVDGLAVRAQVGLGRAEGWTVTAHTTAGDVRTYPALYRFHSDSGGVAPERLVGITLTRDGRIVRMSYERPDQPRTIDKIRAHIDVESLAYGRGHLHRSVIIDPDRPFPRHVDFRLPNWVKWYDLRMTLEVTNTDAGGRVIGGRYYPVRRPSAALHGSRVERVVSAGAHAVEVTGGVSPIRAERVCGDDSCEGALATLVVDRGREVQRVRVRYTARGEFHVTIWVPKDVNAVDLKVDGPGRLDSGPYQRFSVDR